MSDEQPNSNMYVPASYAAPDPRAIAREFPFATLTTVGPEGPLATLAPIFFETEAADEMRLIGHMARRNVQASMLENGQRALVLFNGPHAYISASWYRERPTVPTWNYVSAQVSGTLAPIDDPAEQLGILRLTAERLEGKSDGAWTLEQAPPGRVEELVPFIRSFRISIEAIGGATKLSQAQPASDRLRVIDALELRGRSGDLEIARRMRALDGSD